MSYVYKYDKDIKIYFEEKKITGFSKELDFNETITMNIYEFVAHVIQQLKIYNKHIVFNSTKNSIENNEETSNHGDKKITFKFENNIQIEIEIENLKNPQNIDKLIKTLEDSCSKKPNLNSYVNEENEIKLRDDKYHILRLLFVLKNGNNETVVLCAAAEAAPEPSEKAEPAPEEAPAPEVAQAQLEEAEAPEEAQAQLKKAPEAKAQEQEQEQEQAQAAEAQEEAQAQEAVIKKYNNILNADNVLDLKQKVIKKILMPFYTNLKSKLTNELKINDKHFLDISDKDNSDNILKRFKKEVFESDTIVYKSSKHFYDDNKIKEKLDEIKASINSNNIIIIVGDLYLSIFQFRKN